MKRNRRPDRLERSLATLAFLALTTAAACAAGDRSLHDPTAWPLVWVEPGAEQTIARPSVVYGRPAGRDLTLDVVVPAGLAAGEKRPAVVFVSGFGDDPANPLRSWEIYRSWMRTVAARGLVGVMGETDGEDVPGSLAALFGYLAAHGGELGVDAERLAVWACSGNVSGALPFVQSKDAPHGLRAAALLYGAGEAPALRSDLPVLLVVAGKDGEELLAAERALAAKAREQAAPWTVVEAPTLPHAFDAFDTSRESRVAIAQVLAFLEANLGCVPEPRAEDDARRAAREALGKLYARDYEGAHEYFNRIADTSARGDVHAWLDLAWARSGMGSAVGAMLALEQAVVAAPDDLALRRRYARSAAQLGGWGQVEEALAPIAGKPEADATDLGLLGLARLNLGRPADAVEVLERAVSLGAAADTRYNLACAYARTGRVDDALTALDAAVTAGFADAKLLAEDPDLEPLRGDPRFTAIVERVPAGAAPPPPASPGD